VEGFQPTLKKWLPRQPGPCDPGRAAAPARRLRQPLQHRPAAPVPAPPGHPRHRLRCPPKAVPGDRTADAHHRVRTDRIDANGKLTLRLGGKLHHIGTGRTHARTPVLMVIQDLHIRIINAAPANNSAT